MDNYDSWKLANGQDKPNKKVYMRCAHCEDAIVHGDEIRTTQYGIVHADCFSDFAKDIMGGHGTSIAGEE